MRNKLLILFALFLFGLFLPKISHAARLWSTGFELQSATADVEIGVVDGVSPTIDTTIKRSGAASLRFNTTADWGYFYYSFAANNPTVDHYIRFYLYIATAPDSLDEIFLLKDVGAGGWTASIKLNADRTLELWDRDGGTTPVQLGNDSDPLDLATWYRIEIAFDYIGASDNTITAYINGASFATGNDVGVGGIVADQPSQIFVGAISAATTDLYFDDIAINNNSGTAQNGLPGAGSIVHLWPNGDGDNEMGDSGPTTAQTPWQMVDETTPNDATDYWELITDNDILDVACQDSSVAGIGANDTITLVQVGIRHVIETGTASLTLAPRIKSASGGTTTQGTSFTHNDVTWKTNGDAVPRNYKLTSYTDPTTGIAWTPTGVNSLDNMQIGVIATDATPDAWISTLWALVEYVPGTPPRSSATPSEKVRGGVKVKGGVKFR